MANIVVMVSGGIDSVVLTHWAHQQGHNLRLLFIDYGQDNVRGELFSARVTSNSLDLPLEVIDLSGLRRTFLGLTGYHYRMGSPTDTRIAPNNICNDMQALECWCAEYAILAHQEELMVGSIADDKGQIPRLEELHRTMEKCINLAYESTGCSLKIVAPFLSKTKVEVVTLGETLRVDFAHTWSCESSGTEPCGICKGCGNRDKAFRAAGVKDTLGSKGIGGR